MHASWRVLLRILPALICTFLAAGCAEYNRIGTISEENSLSGVVQLTDGFDRAGEAFFSTDQRWIVFQAVAVTGESPRLYLAKLLTGASEPPRIERPICITPAGTRSGHGSFSGDGLSLIFASSAQAPSGSVKRSNRMRIFRADGWEGMIAMADRTTGVDLAQHAIEITDSQDCSYSPDGNWICFSIGTRGSSRLAMMHPDGSHLVQLTNPKDDDAQPALSPNGKALVYTSGRDARSGSQIYRADLAFDRDRQVTGVTGEQPLTHDDLMNLNPAWHPDGRHIIYATSLHGRNNYELYVMDNQGYHKTRITFFPGADLFPVFSPDGKYLMWTSKRSANATDEVFMAKFQFPRGS